MIRILVVDDDSGHRLVLRSRLAERGYEVTLAESGARGLMDARAAAFDLFLVASNLGSGIDGHEVCRRLKGIPETSAVPVVLFNHHSLAHENLERGFDVGCDAFVIGGELSGLEHQLRLLIRQRRLQQELSDQVRALQEQNRRLCDERLRNQDHENHGRDANGEHAAAMRELAAGRPEGILVVDAEGTVRQADRGASEFLGGRIEGRQLGSLVPASGLEAFVRDARIEAREGFRFDVAARRGRTARSLTATVIPLVVHPGEHDPGLRIVMIFDAAKRRLAAEILRVQDPGIPRQALGSLLEAAREMFRPDMLIGHSRLMCDLRESVLIACRCSAPVLLRGERGTGKERIARTLHYGGSSTGAYLQIRCGGLTPEDLELELFGHVKGAHPAAVADRPGLFHMAQDGTLYLEEIGDLPLDLQDRLARFLEEGTILRKGTHRAERMDVRVIVSSVAPLEGAVQEGRFKPELFAHLSKVSLCAPALAQRPEDIEPLAHHCLRRFGAPRQIQEFTEEALWILRQHDWPGNVAELEDCVEQACARATESVVRVEDLPRGLRDQHLHVSERQLIPVKRPEGPQALGTHTVGTPKLEPEPVIPRTARSSREPHLWDITDEDPISLDLYEKKALLRALEQVHGDKLAAARLLKVGKSTLYRKLKRFGIA